MVYLSSLLSTVSARALIPSETLQTYLDYAITMQRPLLNMVRPVAAHARFHEFLSVARTFLIDHLHQQFKVDVSGGRGSPFFQLVPVGWDYCGGRFASSWSGRGGESDRSCSKGFYLELGWF